MICTPCGYNKHEDCDDVIRPKDGYRSCFCQHKDRDAGKWTEKPKGLLGDS